MRVSSDSEKNERNIRERGLSFERVTDLDWETAISREDARRDYGERRIQVFGLLEGRLHAAVFTMRGTTMHVISFRRANTRDVERYGQSRR